MDAMNTERREKLEYAYLYGNGFKGPLGVFFADDDGIPESADMTEGWELVGGKWMPTYDALVDMKHGVDARWWSECQWLWAQEGHKRIRKAKRPDQTPIWEESTKMGEPDVLLGRPTYIHSMGPDSWAASSYVGLFFKPFGYHIVDSTFAEAQRLIEVQAHRNKDKWIFRGQSDAAPMESFAFSRGRLPAS